MENRNGISQTPLQEDTSLDLKKYVFKYLRYWYWFAVSMLLTLLVVFLIVRYTVPEYLVQSALLIKDNRNASELSEESILADLGLGGASKNLLNEIQILKSRTLMQEVIEALNLEVIYFEEGRVRNSELYPHYPVYADSFQLEPKAYKEQIRIEIVDSTRFLCSWDGANEQERRFGEWFSADSYGAYRIRYNQNSPPEKGDAYYIKFNNSESLAMSYQNRLSIRPAVEKSTVLQLNHTTPVPDKGKAMLNKLVEVYQKAAIEDKNTVARNTLDFIDERLALLTQELNQVEGNVENYKRQNEIATEIGSDLSYIFEELARYETQAADLETQLSIVKSLEVYLQKPENDFALIPSNLVLSNIDLSLLIGQYNNRVLERRRLLQNAGTDNPVVAGLEPELVQLRENIRTTIRQIENGLLSSLEKVRTKNQGLNARLRSVPQKERELLEIKRQQFIKENLYLYLLQKQEETALSLAVTVSNSRVVESPMTMPNPVKPNKKFYYVFGVLLGLFIPFAFITLHDFFSDSLKTEEDVKKMTHAPILGSIAYSKQKDTIVVQSDSRSAIAEMFRLLRANLQFFKTSDQTPSILITSSTSGEGKTFIAVNLGLSIALSGKKTILLGLDLRKPKLRKYLDAPQSSPGLTTYLVNEATLDEIIVPSERHPLLYYISSGPVPPNPSELLMHNKMDELFDRLKQEFDYILIDTPPVGLVSDAFLLNKYSTNTIYTVRFGLSRKNMLKVLEDIYQNKKLRRPVIVLNGAKRSNWYGYGYYRGGAYGYGSEYYEEGKKKR